MRLSFEDHAAFQRATLHVTVACSVLAAAAAVVGAEALRPGTAVLGGALATLGLALAHLRAGFDPSLDALARGGVGADAAGRTLLVRVRRAHDAITRAARREDAASPEERRALTLATRRAVVALSELLRRRQALVRTLDGALPPHGSGGTSDELEALEARRDAATDPVVRETYGRAARALRERAERARALFGVVARIDARLAAAAAELESTAFAVATRAELTPGDPPAALAAACERLRAANTELGAEHDALAELATLETT
jgi:hypothetical protein